MDRIDLHTHSTASDGSMTPSELVHHAASCGLRAVALTDHDTTVGLTEAQQAANEIGIELVHGVELATWLDKTEFHIVGLDINENNPHFQTAMARMQQIREDRNNQMVARMQAAGVDITLEKLELVISEIRGDPIAKVDDIFLEIKPDDLDLALLQDLEVIIDREGQIRLAAAEVDDAQGAVLRQSRKNIFDDFKIAVDLAEFRVGLRKNLSLRTHDAEPNQKVAGHAVRNQIMLLAVVRERGRRGRADRSGKDARL